MKLHNQRKLNLDLETAVLKCIVGYLGTIELSSDTGSSADLQGIRNCIRRFRLVYSFLSFGRDNMNPLLCKHSNMFSYKVRRFFQLFQNLPSIPRMKRINHVIISWYLEYLCIRNYLNIIAIKCLTAFDDKLENCSFNSKMSTTKTRSSKYKTTRLKFLTTLTILLIKLKRKFCERSYKLENLQFKICSG